MKVATVVTRFATTGGIERSAVAISQELHSKGHEVTVFSSMMAAGMSQRFSYRRIPVIPWNGSSEFLSFQWSSGRTINSKEFHVIHAHGTDSSIFTIITFQSCHRAGVEIRRRLPRMAGTQYNLHVGDTIRLLTERKIFRKRKYRKIIAVAEGVKRELCSLYDVPEDHIVVIPNGVDQNEFKPPDPESKSRHRKTLGLGNNRLILLFVANEFERKGLATIIDALSMLREYPITLIVAGRDDPRYYQEYALRRGVADTLLFMGSVESLLPLYQAADAFVMPTYYEAFSLATLEAAACGLPLIVTKVNGTEDLVVHGQNGFFIERDADSVAGSLRRILDDHQLRSVMSRAAVESTLPYAWSSITDRILDVYDETR